MNSKDRKEVVLPDPVPGARGTAETATRLVAAALSNVGLPIVGEALSLFREWRIKKEQEEGLGMLEKEIEARGVSTLEDLSEGQQEFFIPQAYRFAEQVRIGDYKHNLGVLAKIIAQGVFDGRDDRDSGKVLRAARRLEGLELECLVALARCQEAFAAAAVRSPHDSTLGISNEDLVAAYSTRNVRLDPGRASEFLHELATRGLLTLASGRVDATGYVKNSAFNEIIVAVMQELRNNQAA